jgi:hypothetical protein
MPDSIAINEVKLPKGEIDAREVSIIEIPKLSVRHSESLAIKLFTACGLISIYYQNRFYCLATTESQESATSILSERVKDLGEIKEEKTFFSALDAAVKERLLVEIFRHAASKANYFGIYDRIFFRADENIEPFFIAPSFELTVRDSEDSYGYFLNPTHLPMANCTRLFDRLTEGNRLIKLCSKRFDCGEFLEKGKCRYSFPSFVGLLSERLGRGTNGFDSELEELKEYYDECPGVEDEDFGILYVKRTKDAKTEHAYPSFLAFRELTREERRLFSLEKELRNKLLPPSSVRYFQTKTIMDSIQK